MESSVFEPSRRSNKRLGETEKIEVCNIEETCALDNDRSRTFSTDILTKTDKKLIRNQRFANNFWDNDSVKSKIF